MFVGLTGGIGAGKSTVAHMFAALGARVIFADELAKEVVSPGAQGFEPLVRRFGSEILTPSHEVDRAELARIVFTDAQALRDVEQIIHPLVAQRVQEIQASVPESEILIYESPLLIETQVYKNCDSVIVVVADPQIRLARAQERGMNAEDAAARMHNQLSDAERENVADFVIDNSGSLDELQEQVSHIWAALSSSQDSQ